ncbi:transcription initiation factor TFIID subunit 7 [Monosporozyma unispora]|nr:transcription initiation factor TFIID subunit 7 [Kazachstania unispora]
MAVVKIKRSKNGNPSVDTSPAKKKIKIKTKLNRETSSVSTPRPRIKLNLKKESKEKVVEKTAPLKVKLSLKKKDENGTKQKRHEPRVRVKAIRIPGEGYDSEDSDVETDPLIESGIILRVVPDTQVDFVKNSIEAGDYSGISVKWLTERHAVVTINGYMYGAILVDLPTITEVNKSVDRKNLLKTFDVCQMLLCIKTVSSEEEVFDLQVPDSEDVISNHYEDIIDEINKEKITLLRHHMHNGNNHINSAELNKVATKSYDFNHGLTAPLYNVRNRRFRRKMNPVEFEYVESVVESLLNDDDKAEESVFELITEEEINTKPLPLTTHSQMNVISQQPPQPIISTGSKESSLSLSASTTPHLGAGASSTPGLPRESAELHAGAEDEDEDEDLNLEAAFESEEDESGDTNVIANGKRETEVKSETEDLFNGSGAEDEESEEDESDEDEDEDEEEENDDSRGNKDVKRQHIELLADELKELESTLAHTRRKVAKATNPLLKSRFIDSIKKLEKEVELKKKQLGSIQSEDKSEAATVHDDHEQVQVAEEEEEEDEDMDEDEEESAEDEDDEDRQDPLESPETGENAGNTENSLDQNDLDMMMLFGAEAEEDED